MASEGLDSDRPGDALARAADRISAMLAYWDADRRCRFANRAYERWFGVSPESLIGKHISELLGPLYTLNLPYIEGALRGEPQEFEREIPNPTGGPSRHSLATYIPDVVDGIVRGFVVLVTEPPRPKNPVRRVLVVVSLCISLVVFSLDSSLEMLIETLSSKQVSVN